MQPPWTVPATPRLRTDRLDLLPLAEADAAGMVDVLGDPALYAFIGGQPPSERELQARFARMVLGHSADGTQLWHNWVVRLRATGAPIGTVQATVERASPLAEIAWVIGVPWQGQGLATEAAVGLVAWLERIGIAEILAHVHPRHAASGAVAARAGLEPTEAIDDGERVWRRTIRPVGAGAEGR